MRSDSGHKFNFHHNFNVSQNLKTYTRHSGGKLTVDLTNEVLKDADVPPVIGAGINNWNQIDYDGTYYFHFVIQKRVYLSGERFSCNFQFNFIG